MPQLCHCPNRLPHSWRGKPFTQSPRHHGQRGALSHFQACSSQMQSPNHKMHQLHHRMFLFPHQPVSPPNDGVLPQTTIPSLCTTCTVFGSPFSQTRMCRLSWPTYARIHIIPEVVSLPHTPQGLSPIGSSRQCVVGRDPRAPAKQN